MKVKNIFFIGFIFLSLVSCFNSKKPNYQYMPNMYEPLGYKPYAASIAFPNGMEAQLPVEGTIPRGWEPYDYENSEKGYQAAKLNLKSPITFLDEDRENAKYLYDIYCAVCHGKKGDGQGILMQREKFLGIPNYKDRDITEGSIYHVLMYGRNTMGSYASQLSAKERWQVTQYVLELREQLK